MTVTGHSCVNDGRLRKLRDTQYGFLGPPGVRRVKGRLNHSPLGSAAEQDDEDTAGAEQQEGDE